jgi:prevent-host-death family protein
MKELSVTEAREQFPALLNQAAKKPVWITRHGVDVAVVISPELFEELVAAQEELEDIAAVDEAMLDKSPGIPWNQVQRKINMKLYALTLKRKVLQYLFRKRDN